VDVASDSVVVQITGTEDKIASLLELLNPLGVLEMVRTGNIAMMRGAMSGKRYYQEKQTVNSGQ
jgi:acetolactate synthase-1/3 small subunit